ncbi:MAG TPA: hypothetical protein VM554_16200 [Acidisarcina sp.]|nr:hypothetical protein [Acidisarcina sp.]
MERNELLLAAAMEERKKAAVPQVGAAAPTTPLTLGKLALGVFLGDMLAGIVGAALYVLVHNL